MCSLLVRSAGGPGPLNLWLLSDVRAGLLETVFRLVKSELTLGSQCQNWTPIVHLPGTACGLTEEVSASSLEELFYGMERNIED